MRFEAGVQEDVIAKQFVAVIGGLHTMVELAADRGDTHQDALDDEVLDLRPHGQEAHVWRKGMLR